MPLSHVWFLVGLATAATLNCLDLTSDYLGLVLPLLSVALSAVILLLGTRTAGARFARDMVVPVGLGLKLIYQPLSEMVILPLVFGCWFGLANRSLARPVSVLAFVGQAAVIVSAGWLFSRHLGVTPAWMLAGLACYAALSCNLSGPRVLE